MMRKLISNTDALSNILIYILTIFSCGALYSLLFIDFGFPEMSSWIPETPTKILMMTLFRAIPGIIMLVCMFGLIREGIKKTRQEGY